MKYVAISPEGESLSIQSRPRPALSSSDVMVEVRCFGVNRADVLQRAGMYPPPPGASDILGLECSGVIVEVGNSVTDWRVGDEVMGLVDGGAYAQYCAIDAGLVWRKPKYMSFEEAAAFPEAFVTAFQSLYYLSDIRQVKDVLIHAGASSVSQAILQLIQIKNLKIRTFCTASTGKQAFCRSLGFDEVIDYRTEDFVDKVTAVGKGVDLVIDYIAGDYFAKNLKVLSVDGTLVMLGALGGGRIKEMSIMPVLSKRIKIQGSTLRARTLIYKQQLIAYFNEVYGAEMKEGKIIPNVYTSMSWTKIEEAHASMNNNTNKGKMVMVID